MSLSNLLDQYFDVAFAAPDGVKKLRELILSLAMQGKLVPQDEADQPASELLKEIAAEKSQLVKDGKIKASKPLPEIKPDEVPYDLPKGWEWVRVRNICHDWGQKTPDSLFTYIDVGSIDNKRGVIGDDVQLIESVDAPSRARKIVHKGTVIYSTVRPYLLNIAIVDKDFSPEPIASTAFAILHPFCEISNRFIYYYLRSPVFISYVESTMKGVAYPAINDGDFFQGLFPLPPLTEQRRIVAKIDELMARCDELEKLKTERDRKQITVHQAALNRLLTAKDHSDFQTSWHFITQHFSELYSVKENVAELRKVILQLAVMGKLVPQDNNDRPASELLKEIEKEKQKLIKEGKIKASKPLPEIKSDEVPYDLPKNWKWVRLGEITQIKGGKRVSNGYKLLTTPTPYIYIRVSDMKNGSIDDSDLRFIDEVMHNKIKQYVICKEDIYMTIVGATIGKCGIVPAEFHEMNLTENAARIILYKSISRIYLLRCLESSFCQKQFVDKTKQVGVQKMALNRLLITLIPLPPLAEQHRIVAKIDRLMTLCDELEKQIDSAESKQTKLLNSLMAKV